MTVVSSLRSSPNSTPASLVLTTSANSEFNLVVLQTFDYSPSLNGLMGLCGELIDRTRKHSLPTGIERWSFRLIQAC